LEIVGQLAQKYPLTVKEMGAQSHGRPSSLPSPAAPCRALPRLPSHATPGLALPRHAKPCLALPGLAMPVEL